MSSRKQGSQTRGQQSAEEDNFKKPTRSNMQRSKMRGASSGKKTAGPQQKNLEAALPGRWGGRSAETPFGVREEDQKEQTEDPWKWRWWQYQRSTSATSEEKGPG